MYYLPVPPPPSPTHTHTHTHTHTGYWRVFDLDYRDQVFQHILTLLEEEDWSWKSVPFEKCCEKLKDLEPSFALEHCLKCYGIKYYGEEGDVKYELLEDKVCQFYGELLLRPAGKVCYIIIHTILQI